MSFNRIFLAILFSAVLTMMTHCSPRVVAPPPPPVLTSINIIDRNGFSETISSVDRLKQYASTDFLKSQPYQKVLRVYGRDYAGNVRAYITSYYPNGQTKQYLEVVNNRAFGTYQEWHETGAPRLKANITGGEGDIDTAAEKSWLFDGLTEAWDENGNISAQIPYTNGELNGVSLYYHSNGKLWKQVPCCKGNIEGLMQTWLPDGTLFQSTEYKDGYKNGVSKRYWGMDKIASEETFSQGLLIAANYFDICGKLLSEIREGCGFRVLFGKETMSEMQEFRQGIQEGTIKIYDELGRLASSHQIKDGIRNGEEIEYYIGTLNPKLSINWVDNKIQGLVKTWYPNGVPESRREMNDNSKNGFLTAWYIDGSLMLVEEYAMDKLVKGEYFVKGERIPISTISLGQGVAILHDSNGNLLKKISYTNGKPELN